MPIDTESFYYEPVEGSGGNNGFWWLNGTPVDTPNRATLVFGGPANAFKDKPFGGVNPIYGPLSGYPGINPDVINDASQDSPEVINGVNIDLINEAIRNLPNPIYGYPPIQTGPTASAPQPGPTVTPTQQEGYQSTRPDETGRNPGVRIPDPTGGSGQIPNPPPSGGGGGSDYDPFDILGEILRGGWDIFNGGNGGGTPPFFPDSGGDMDDDFWDWIFGGSSGGAGGNATATGGNATGGNATGGNNSLGDILTDVVSNFDFGGMIGDLGDTVINNALSADAYEEIGKQQERDLEFRQGIYDADVERLDPYNQLGLRNIQGLEDAAQSNPVKRNVFAGQESITTDPSVNRRFANGGLPAMTSGNRNLRGANPNVNYTAPTRSKVEVNQNNPFDLENDIGYNFLKDEMTDSVQGSAVAQGGLLSGDALEALQDRSAGLAATYAGQLQDIYSARDGLELASDNQFFNQGFNLAGLDLGAQAQEFGQTQTVDEFLNFMNRQDFDESKQIRDTLFSEDIVGTGFDRDTEQIGVENKLRKNAQLYDQLFNANSQDLTFDNNEFNKLLALVSGGQSSAAGQAGMGQGFADSIGQILTDKGYLDFAERSDRNDNYLDFISRIIS